MSTETTVGAGASGDGEAATAGTAVLTAGPQDAEAEAARWADLERRVAQATTPLRPPAAQWVLPVMMAVLAGISLHRYVPCPPAAVAAVAALLALVIAVCPELLRVQAARGQAPDVKELDDYARWLPRRVPAVPAATLAVAERHAQALTRGRWRSVHLLIARREDGGRPLAQNVRPGDRVELILDDHVAEGPADVAAGMLAHEARHCDPLAMAVSALSTSLCLPLPVLVAAWALPWPGTLTPGAVVQAVAMLAVLRAAATVMFCCVEIACDLGAAADQGMAAQRAVWAVHAAEDARMTRSYARVAAVRLLNLGAPPPHPPLWMRRAAVSLRRGRAAGRARGAARQGRS